MGGLSRKVHGWLKDEQGDNSMARLLLVVTVPFAFGVILADIFVRRVEVPGEVYALLGGLLTGEIAWAGGARIARYIGPQIAGIAQGIAAKVAPSTTVEVNAASQSPPLPPGTTTTTTVPPPAEET